MAGQEFRNKNIRPAGYRSIGVITSNTIAGYWDYMKLDPSSGSITVSLLSALNRSGFSMLFKNVSASSNPIILDPFGAETIDGRPTLQLCRSFASVLLISNGVGWETALDGGPSFSWKTIKPGCRVIVPSDQQMPLSASIAIENGGDLIIEQDGELSINYGGTIS